MPDQPTDAKDFYAGFDKQVLRVEQPLTPGEGKALVAEATLQAHNQGYEQGRLAGMGVMVAILRRCEPFIAGLTHSHKPLKYDAQRLYDDIIGALKSAENTEDWRDHYTF